MVVIIQQNIIVGNEYLYILMTIPNCILQFSLFSLNNESFVNLINFETGWGHFLSNLSAKLCFVSLLILLFVLYQNLIDTCFLPNVGTKVA